MKFSLMLLKEFLCLQYTDSSYALHSSSLWLNHPLTNSHCFFSVLHGSCSHLYLVLQFIPGHSPRAANGLLSPPLEDTVHASQNSLCDILQEKEKKTSTSTGTGTSLGMTGGMAGAGTSMDHSALIQLRAKNYKQKTDTNFVDVIRENR